TSFRSRRGSPARTGGAPRRQRRQSPNTRSSSISSLLCVSDSPLTPSEMVDQVWHLHLVYTRSYWTAFCDGVLGRPLHHEPTRGGEAQAGLFKDQYALTLARYEAEFGGAPAAEFWPSHPFDALPSQRWVDRRAHWIVPK